MNAMTDLLQALALGSDTFRDSAGGAAIIRATKRAVMGAMPDADLEWLAEEVLFQAARLANANGAPLDCGYIGRISLAPAEGRAAAQPAHQPAHQPAPQSTQNEAAQ